MPTFVDNAEERLTAIARASRDGNLYRSHFQGQVPVGETYYFTIEIPKDVQLVGFGRVTSVEDGSIRTQFSVGTGYTTEVAAYPAFNFDTVDGKPAQGVMKRVTGPIGATAHSPNELLATATAGGVRVPSVQTSVGAQVVLSNKNMPFFSIENVHTSAVSVVLALVWQELNGRVFR